MNNNKKYLDGKTLCTVISDNGVLAKVRRKGEEMVVFSFRLKENIRFVW